MKHWLIPHAGNDYHPHLLHTHRAVKFSSAFVALKLLLFAVAISLPATAYLAPDRLAAEEQKILTMTNTLREEQGLSPLREQELLDRSAALKSNDMASEEYFAHDGPDGKHLPDWLRDVGYSYLMAGENLAMGVATAEEMVHAWVESPTHYANLVGERYAEQGIHMVSGMNRGWPVLYVTHHFGEPVERAPLPGDTGITLSPTATTISIQPDQSFLDWSTLDRGTVLAAGVSVHGDVVSGKIISGDLVIPLTRETGDIWTGSVYLDESPDEFFRVMTPATVELLTRDGSVHRDSLNWQRPYLPEGSAVNTYNLAQRIGPLVGAFAVSKYFYALFVLVFSIALLINIFVEVRRQHFHIIGQTLSVIVLLVSLMIV